MDFKVHLAEIDLVRMIFTDSYIGSIHLGKKVDFLVEVGPGKKIQDESRTSVPASILFSASSGADDM